MKEKEKKKEVLSLMHYKTILTLKKQLKGPIIIRLRNLS